MSTPPPRPTPRAAPTGRGQLDESGQRSQTATVVVALVAVLVALLAGVLLVVASGSAHGSTRWSAAAPSVVLPGATHLAAHAAAPR